MPYKKRKKPYDRIKELEDKIKRLEIEKSDALSIVKEYAFYKFPYYLKVIGGVNRYAVYIKYREYGDCVAGDYRVLMDENDKCQIIYKEDFKEPFIMTKIEWKEIHQKTSFKSLNQLTINN